MKALSLNVKSLFLKKEALVRDLAGDWEAQEKGEEERKEIKRETIKLRELEREKAKLDRSLFSLSSRLSSLSLDRTRLLAFQTEQEAMLRVEEEMGKRVEEMEGEVRKEEDKLRSLQKAKLSLLSALFLLGPLPSPSSESSSSSSPASVVGVPEGVESSDPSRTESDQDPVSTKFRIVNIYLKPDDYYSGLLPPPPLHPQHHHHFHLCLFDLHDVHDHLHRSSLSL